MQNPFITIYCVTVLEVILLMEEILHQLIGPIGRLNFRVGGARFLPSTVPPAEPNAGQLKVEPKRNFTEDGKTGSKLQLGF